MEIIPSNLDQVTYHVEAIINGRQIGIAISNGVLMQCVDRKSSVKKAKYGKTIEQAATELGIVLLANGGVQFA